MAKRLHIAAVHSTQLGNMRPAKKTLSRIIGPVARYTQFVRAGRSFLWAMIALMIVMIVYISSGIGNPDKARLVFNSIKQMGDLQNIMKNPHYQGLDAHNLPFSIIADQAIQRDAQTVWLSNIHADMTNKGGKWVAMQAGEGVFKNDTKILTLTKGVDMFYEGGYEFRTDRAVVNIDKGFARGDAHIEGQGAFGTLSADSFEAKERGKVIVFNGSVRTMIYRK